MITVFPPRNQENPLAAWDAVPANESPEQRRVREAAEELARKHSAEIDEQLKADRAALKKRKRMVKVLVLGQSESGTYNSLSHLLSFLLLWRLLGRVLS